MNGTIWIDVDLAGWHHWPDAPPHRAYLAASHRHLFGVRVELPAEVDDDRHVEFHDLRDLVVSLWPADGQWGASSCESIAAWLGARVMDQLRLPWITVTVDEDGEAGATVALP